MNIRRIVSLVSFLALIALIAGTFQQRPGPHDHRYPLGLAGGVPATLYYQDRPDAPPVALPGVDGPAPGSGSHAGVVIGHGFAADRNTMEALSESLAGAGYTVISLDLSGHGLNRNPDSFSGVEQLGRDLDAGVRYLHDIAGFDASKIVLLGHSMGARAALDYGSRTDTAGGVILLGGTTQTPGPHAPPNSLFLYAEHDLPGIARGVAMTAARLLKVDHVETGTTYGDFAAGTALRIAEIPGVNHGGLVTSPVAFAEIVGWLDQVTGFPAREVAPLFVEHPLGSPLLWLSFFLVLPGLGLALARLAPELPAVAPAGWTELGMLAVSLLLPLPFIALGRPGALMGLSIADGNVTHLTLVGVLLVTGLLLLGRLRLNFHRVPAAVSLALTGWVVVSILFAPVSAHFHGVSLTPEKALIASWSALCLAPLALAMQYLLHRPQWWRGTLLRLAARLAVLGCVAAGLALGVYAAGVIAVLVLLASLVIVEPVLAGFYGRSRNILVAAGFDAMVTAWLFALLLPTTT